MTERPRCGRPTRRTSALTDKICRLIAAGKSLRAIGRMRGMPHADTVRRWLQQDAAFSVQYARAREAQADVFADEIVELADRSIGKDAATVQAHRLAVDARKWAAAKLRPRKYGDRGGPISLQLPQDLSSPAGLAAAALAILRGACDGTLLPSEAGAFITILDVPRRAVETEDLDRRIRKLAVALGVNDDSSMATPK